MPTLRWSLFALLVACSEPTAVRGTPIVFTALPRAEAPAQAVDRSRPRHDALETTWPDGSEAVAPPTPHEPGPAVGLNFVGLPFSAAGLPPDTMGAVGPNHLMVTLNSEVRVLTKAGTPLSTVTLGAFWTPTGATAPFDPAVAFHPGLNRWLTIAVSNRRSAAASLLIGVSQTTDPTAGWNLFRIDGDPGDTTWPDYPRLGFNGQWAVVAANMFGNPTGSPFVQSKVFVFSLADLQANLAAPTVLTSPFITLVPAQVFDPAAPDVVVVATANTPLGLGLALPRVSGPLGAPTLTASTAAARLASPLPYSFSVVPAPQLGSTTRVDGVTFNSSETQTAVVRNGRLFAAHQVGLPQTSPTRTSLQWWEVDTQSNTLVAVGRVDDPTGTRAYSHPALAVNRAGDVMLGYTRFGTDVYPSAAFSLHLANDPPGSLRDEVVFKAGEAPYTRTAPTVIRWGDYSASAVDPSDDCTLWTIQEYAALANTWGTWWAQVPMPDQPLRLSVPPVAPVPEDSAPASVLATALSRVVACVRPAAPLVLHATAQTPTLMAVDAGAPTGSLAPVSWALVPNANGPAVLRVTLADGTATTSADLAFTVTEVNDPPVAVADVATLDEDTVTFLGVTANDAPGPPNESTQVLRVSSVPATTAQGGALAIDGGVVRYTPPPDFNGLDSFTYTVTDDGTTNGVAAPASATGTVSLTVAAVNDLPRLNPLTRTTPEDTALVLPGAQAFAGTPGPADEAAQGLWLVAVEARTDAGGAASLDGGALVYLPPPDFFGFDSVTVTVRDDGVPPAAATVRLDLSVTPVNDPPLAREDALTVVEDTAAFVADSMLLANDSPGPLENSQALRVVAFDGGGRATAIDGGVRLQWPPDFNGAERFVYRVADDGAPPLEAEGGLLVTVTEVNDAPAPRDDDVTASARQPLTLAASALLSNDAPGPANEASQSLTVSAVAPRSLRGGTVQLAGRDVIYTAAQGFSGADSFTYVAMDDGTTAGVADPRSTTATVRVTVTDTNEAPVARDDQVPAREDTPLVVDVLANDAAGPAFESLQRLTLVQVPATSEQGGALRHDGGVVSYSPPPDFNGVDRFSYRLRDDGQTNGQPDPKEAMASVTLTVAAVNDAPRLEPDVATTEQGTTRALDVAALLANDSPGPADERAQALQVVNVEGATLDGALVQVTPAPGFVGVLTVRYTARDDGLTDGQPDPRTSEGVLEVTVTPAPPKGCGCGATDLTHLVPFAVLLLARRRASRLALAE